MEGRIESVIELVIATILVVTERLSLSRTLVYSMVTSVLMIVVNGVDFLMSAGQGRLNNDQQVN